MGSSILEEAIEAAIDVKASQRIKAWKRNQAYMVDTIEELRHEIHNLQVTQAKLRQSKPVTPAEPLQGIRNQIISYRGRGGLRGKGRGRGRGGFT